MPDSGKTSEASRLPAVPRSSNDLQNERTRDIRPSLFGSYDEYDDEYDYSSPRSTRAPSDECVDDGSGSRHNEYSGTAGKGTTLKWDELKP